jgi:5S rRNA maturation endonuclease (ribonuclease M5)
MAASQHSRVLSTVSRVDLTQINRIQSVERHNGQLASVLRDARGIIFIDYLEKGQNINSEYYMALLEHLNDEIKKKTAPFEKKSARKCTVSHINQNDGKIA